MKYYRTILNVQGGVPFVPTNIAGCQLWLDAADADTISIGTGVSQWDDKSGQGNNATQTLGANQPSYQLAVQNGLNVIRFDGSNDYLLANSLASALTGNDTPYSFLFAFSKNNSNVLGDILDATNFITGQSYIINRFQNDAKIQFFRRREAGSPDVNVKTTLSYDTNFSILEIYFTGTNLTVYYDNTIYINNASLDTDSLTLTYVIIGAIVNTFAPTGSAFFGGDIGEILSYNANRLTNRVTLYDYLSTKWGI